MPTASSSIGSTASKYLSSRSLCSELDFHLPVAFVGNYRGGLVDQDPNSHGKAGQRGRALRKFDRSSKIRELPGISYCAEHAFPPPIEKQAWCESSSIRLSKLTCKDVAPSFVFNLDCRRICFVRRQSELSLTFSAPSWSGNLPPQSRQETCGETGSSCCTVELHSRGGLW